MIKQLSTHHNNCLHLNMSQLIQMAEAYLVIIPTQNLLNNFVTIIIYIIDIASIIIIIIILLRKNTEKIENRKEVHSLRTGKYSQ